MDAVVAGGGSDRRDRCFARRRSRRREGNRCGARDGRHPQAAGGRPAHHRRGHARPRRVGPGRCSEYAVRGGPRGGRNPGRGAHGRRRSVRPVRGGAAASHGRWARCRPGTRRPSDVEGRHAAAAHAAARRASFLWSRASASTARAGSSTSTPIRWPDTWPGAFGRAASIIAGSTAGVLDASGRTIPLLDPAAIAQLVTGGTATAGMIAKLRACEAGSGRRSGRCRDRGRPRSGRAAGGGMRRHARRSDSSRDYSGNTIMTTSSTSALEEIQAREARHVLQTYRRNPMTFVRGQGVRLFDSEGREYFDLLSGIGVASLGHAHPGIARAIADQAQQLLHTSNLFFHPLQGQVAERLSAMSGLPRTFFCNSGSRGRRGLSEVCPSLLVHEGRAARRVHRARRIVPRTDLRRLVGHVRRTLPRAVRAAAARGPVRSRERSRRAPRGGVVEDRRDHRRAGAGRRRRPAADARRLQRRSTKPARRPARCSSRTKCSRGLGRTGVAVPLQ